VLKPVPAITMLVMVLKLMLDKSFSTTFLTTEKNKTLDHKFTTVKKGRERDSVWGNESEKEKE